uniref:Uncharacterized protein n=1 Tax=Parascaris equorum TaxID=6256 RepID=A0A914RLL8_PAREQ
MATKSLPARPLSTYALVVIVGDANNGGPSRIGDDSMVCRVTSRGEEYADKGVTVVNTASATDTLRTTINIYHQER